MRITGAGITGLALAGVMAAGVAIAATAALPGGARTVRTATAVPAAAGDVLPRDERTAAEDARRSAAAAAAVRAENARVAARAAAARVAARAAAARAAAAKAAARSAAPAPTVRVSAPKAAVRTETYLQRGNRVLASLHYDWRALGYRLEFRPERGGYLGFTDGATKTVTIYVRDSESDLVLAHSIAHELGHVLDFTRGTESTRSAYLHLRGLNPRQPWFGCAGCTDFRTPAGDWAEVFAAWLAGPGDFRSQLGPAPTASQLDGLDRLFQR